MPRNDRTKERTLTEIDYSKYDFRNDTKKYEIIFDKGLNENVVKQISKIKNEPSWMTEFRLKALDTFTKKPMPTWGADLSSINFDEIVYYMRSSEANQQKWEDVPQDIKNTFDRLGIPEAERKFLGGVGVQYESEVVYHSIREDLQKQGVVFLGMDQGLKEYEDIVRQYFGTIVPPSDNKFAALNSAVWSGGSFVFIPKNTKVDVPLQAYFRINAQNMGQFERTLIIAEEGSRITYVEGCFTRGTEIRTENGIKPIEEIQVGEKVLTHKNRFMPAYHVQTRPYSGKLFTIEYSENTFKKIETTKEHPFLCVKKENAKENKFNPYWIMATDLNEGDYLAMPTSITKQKRFILTNAQKTNGPTKQLMLQKTSKTESEEPVYNFVQINKITSEQVYGTDVYNFSVEEDESYVAGGVVVHNCTAPRYSSNSLHSAVVEIIAKEGSHVRYTTIQNWANNIYNLVTKRAVAHKNASVEWVDGNIGCLAEGSTVTTPEGTKSIESLEVGDMVLSFDEKTGQFCFQPVIAKRFSGYQQVHAISVGERKLVATANHPFYSYTYNATAPSKLGRYKMDYVRADKLKKAIIPRTSIDYGAPYPLKAPNLVTEFKSMNQYESNLLMTRVRHSKMAAIQFTMDDLMWLFGYWVGDGNIEIKHGKTDGVIRFAKVGFSTPQKDRARPKLMQTMTALIQVEPTERSDGYHLAWSSKELAEFFHANGFKGKAKDKRAPNWVWSLPESQRLAFISGYIDADGNITNRSFNIKSVNRALLEDIASLLVTLGITSRLHTEFSEPKTVTILGYECTAHGSHRLVFNADERFTSFMSPALQEKVKNQPKRKQQLKRLVGRSNIQLSENVEIAKVKVSTQLPEAVPTWDIEVAGTGNFVSQGFIVHNSHITAKYPSVYMVGEGAKAEILSVALAGRGQHQDAGAKVVHMAPNTTSTITSKSISKDGGRTSYRGLVKVYKGCKNVKNTTKCDALLLDDKSRSDTYPTIEIDEPTATIAHEATVGKVGDDQIFYLMSRGLSQEEALTLIVMGFIQPFTKELPMEYAIELNRLIQMEMEDSVG